MKNLFFCFILIVIANVSFADDAISRRCGDNETFNNCASPCDIEATCDVLNPPQPNICIERCDQKCICNQGYIRSKTNEKCIKVEHCQFTCGENEVLGSIQPCCGHRTCSHSDVCNKKCAAIYDCICKEGFVLTDPHGTCVPLHNCPKKED